ncbi:hypothetical protein R8Z50_20885 [Longispora sp. K20-0274]|uniref:hypothetical protein n=1 Tax=Longispora sp. K20-0274 TaxID=3088255 RepID=UPI00399950F8
MIQDVEATLCDVCGRVLAADEARTALLPDSSAVHPTRRDLDGLRPVSACGPDHLAAVTVELSTRDWADEELWAGQIVRALTDAAPDTVGRAELARATSLSHEQIERAVTWHNTQIHRIGLAGHGPLPL